MKAIALLLLATAALLYAIAEALQGRHPAWGYVAAFAEAAMVGAIADWFAVVALFRHPLGLPIPHTAIIPRSKDRLGESLANFLCTHFLGTTQLMARIRKADPSGSLARWLAQPARAEKIGAVATRALRQGLGWLDQEGMRGTLQRLATAGLRQVDPAPLLGRVLQLLSADGRHRPLLDDMLRRLAAMLDDAELQAQLSTAIAHEIRALRYVRLDHVAARAATGKIVAAVAHTLHDMADDPQHPLRQRFEDAAQRYILQLQHDAGLQERGRALRDELLAHPALGSYLHGLWDQLVAYLQGALADPDSALQHRLAATVRQAGARLEGNAEARAWIDDALLEAAPRWIDQYREDIRRYVVARVHDWDAREMTLELERTVGRDLQFIRINGTLVGGLVGLGIHAGTQLIRRWN
jgi:uncharacterized membrane-anchored protein YjiN (DUF445 family)